MDLLTIFGLVMAGIALAAFIGIQYQFLRADGLWYDALNFVSALGLCYFAWKTDALPFVVTNGVWALVSGIDVVRAALGKKKQQRPCTRPPC